MDYLSGQRGCLLEIEMTESKPFVPNATNFIAVSLFERLLDKLEIPLDIEAFDALVCKKAPRTYQRANFAVEGSVYDGNTAMKAIVVLAEHYSRQ